MRKVTGLLMMVLFAAMVGCGDSSGGGSAVGVVDLDRVAEALGRKEVIEQQLRSRQETVRDQLAKLQQQLEQELIDRRQTMGENPTQEQLREGVAAQQQASQRLQAEAAGAARSMDAYRDELLTAFREEAATHLRTIAQEQGLSLILVANPRQVLYASTQIDVTDALTAKMKATP